MSIINENEASNLDTSNKPQGIVMVPYIMKARKTTINNTTVWHSNKFINFLLKIKFFSVNPNI